MAALAEERGHRYDLVVVRAALDHGVHLHRQTRVVGSLDPLEHAVDREVDVVQRAERRVVERVEAHRDARQAGGSECLRLLWEQRAVGRQRQVDAELCELLDQTLDVAAHERLATGDPDLADAAVDEDPRDACDLLEGQKLPPVEEPVVTAVDLLRHAVHAPEVAAVGDRDPEIPKRPSEGIEHVHVRNGTRIT